MARIETYINDDKVSVKDRILGSDGDKNNKTKNFPITGISDFILGQLKNSGVVFRFSDGSAEGIEIGEPGYFFSEGNIIDKTQLTKLYFSVDSYFGEHLAELFTSVGSNLGDLYLGLSQQDDSANYGFFNVVDIINVDEEYFEIEVDLRGTMFAKSFQNDKNYSLFFDLASSSEYDIIIEAGVFKLLKNGAVYKEQDLSLYLDDTNLARITSGLVDTDGIATFKRDDNSEFSVDFSDFLGGVVKTRTSQLINDGDGTNPFVTSDQVYKKSETDNKDAVIQTQVTKLNGLYLERDIPEEKIYLKNADGDILSAIKDSSLDGKGFTLQFNPDQRTLYILDGDGEIVDSIPASVLIKKELIAHNSRAEFPLVGKIDVLYLDKSKPALYIWDGVSDYTEFSSSGLTVQLIIDTLGYTPADAADVADQEIRLAKIEGISLIANQAAQEFYLRNASGETLSTVSVAFLNNEGTTFFYNATTEKLELKNDSGEVLSAIPVSAFVSNIAATLNWNGNTLELKNTDGTVASSAPLTNAIVLAALGFTPETPLGAQAKADSAEQNANNYTDLNAIKGVKTSDGVDLIKDAEGKVTLPEISGGGGSTGDLTEWSTLQW